MGDKLRLAVGVIGNASSLLLYASPIITFLRVIRKKSTEGFSCAPYIFTLSNCLVYTWYGLPVISHKWENFPVATISCLGCLFEFSYIATYFWFASARGKMWIAMTMTAVILVFCITLIISTFAFHDHHHRKVFVGSVGLGTCITMYGSPLMAVKQVILTKSVEFMPFYLSFFSFLNSSIWMAYGLLSHDLFILAPTVVGNVLSILQLMLYCKYRNREGIEEPNKRDFEGNYDEKSQQFPQLALNDSIGGKS